MQRNLTAASDDYFITVMVMVIVMVMVMKMAAVVVLPVAQEEGAPVVDGGGVSRWQ